MAETETPPNPSTHEPPPTGVSSHEAGTENNTFEYQGVQFTCVDLGTDPFVQLQEAAAERGDAGMVGLEWVEGDGLRYRVSSHEKLTRVKQETRKGGPRIAIHGRRGMELERKEIHEPVTEVVDHRTVDVYNADGDLVDILEFTGSRREWVPRTIYGIFKAKTTVYGRSIKPKEYVEVDLFQDHFYVSAAKNPNSTAARQKVPRDIRGFRWVDESAEEVSSGIDRVDAPVVSDEGDDPFNPKSPDDKTQELFEALAIQHPILGGSEGWVGLTWNNSLIPTDREEHWSPNDIIQMQIIRDEILFKKDSPTDTGYLERVFEVRSRSHDGTSIKRQIYTLQELQAFFNRKETGDRKSHAMGSPPVDLDLHWEQKESADPGGKPSDSSVQRRQEEDKVWREYWKEEFPWQDLTLEEHGARIGLSLDEAAAFLCSPELYPDTPHGQAALQAHIDAIKQSERGIKAVEKIQRIVSEVGLERFYAVVGEIHEAYVTDSHRLGIAIHPEDSSLSFTIWELIGKKLIGEPVFFEDSAKGRALRSQFASLDLGVRFHEAALQSDEKSLDVWDPEKEKKTKRPVYLRSDNPEVMRRIEKFLFKEKIETMLERDKKNHAEASVLGAADLAALGQMLRLSLGRD